MAARKHLKAVDESADADVPGPDLSVSEAAESGDRLAELMAMRRVISRHIDSTATLARDLAALTRRQMEISREIEALRNETEGDALGKAADSPDETFNPASV
jgi:hypothetical protein